MVRWPLHSLGLQLVETMGCWWVLLVLETNDLYDLHRTGVSTGRLVQKWCLLPAVFGASPSPVFATPGPLPALLSVGTWPPSPLCWLPLESVPPRVRSVP